MTRVWCELQHLERPTSYGGERVLRHRLRSSADRASAATASHASGRVLARTPESPPSRALRRRVKLFEVRRAPRPGHAHVIEVQRFQPSQPGQRCQALVCQFGFRHADRFDLIIAARTQMHPPPQPLQSAIFFVLHVLSIRQHASEGLDEYRTAAKRPGFQPVSQRFGDAHHVRGNRLLETASSSCSHFLR